MYHLNSKGEKNQNKINKKCPSSNYLLCLEVSLGFYSLRSFLQVFEMVVNQEKSIQLLPEIAKISSHSLDKYKGLNGDQKTPLLQSVLSEKIILST